MDIQTNKEFISNLTLTKKQLLGYEKLQDFETNLLVYGGAMGSGKSVLGCWWMIINCLLHPWSVFIMWREEIKQVKDSTFKTFKQVASESEAFLNLPEDVRHYNSKDNNITFKNGSEIKMFALWYEPSDPDYSRLGSIEICWAFVDEWNKIPRSAVDVLLGRCRLKPRDWYHYFPTVMVSTNPDSASRIYSDIYKPWREGTLEEDSNGRACFIQALPTDNPTLTEDYLDTLRNYPDDKRKRLYEGKWEYTTDNALLFKRDCIVDLFNNTVEEDWDKYISVDVARKGDDKTVIIVRDWLNVVEIVDYKDVPDSYKHRPLKYTVERIKRLERQYQIPRRNIVVDADWVWWWVEDFLPGCMWFINNSRAKQPRMAKYKPHLKNNFSNLKTQCFFKFKELTDAREIAIVNYTSEQKKMIMEELSNIREKDADRDTRIRLERKDILKNKIGRSPDYADALAMRMVYEVGDDRPSVEIL